MEMAPPAGSGRQARRIGRKRRMGYGLVVGLTAMLFGLAIWVVAARPGRASAGAAAGGAAMLGAFGLVFAIALLHDRRKAHTEAPKNVELAVRTTEVRRGGRVQAIVKLTGAPAAGSELELALVCTERYDLTKETGEGVARVAATDDVHTEVARLGSSGGSATFTVPAAAPFSYEGDCLSALWHLRLVERRPRGRDRRLDEPIWVQP